MREIIFLSALLLSLQYRVAGQGVKANTDPLKSKFVAGQEVKTSPDQLKSKFLAAPAAEWNQIFAAYKTEIKDTLVDRWRTQAIALYGTNEIAPAHLLIDVCLHLSNLLQNVDLNGMCLLAKAEIYFQEKDYTHAIDFAQRAGKAFIQSKNTYQLARSKNRMARSYHYAEQEQNSVKAFEEAIALKKQLIKAEPGNKLYNESLYGSLEDFGIALYEMTQYERAIKLYQEALEVSKRVKYDYVEANLLYDIGLAYSYNKQPTEAIVSFEKAIRAYEVSKDSASIMGLYRQLIKAHDAKGDAESARSTARIAIAYGQTIKDPATIINFLQTFITKYKTAEDYKALIPFYIAREKLCAKIYPDSIITLKTDLANAYKGDKEYDKAIEKQLEVYALNKLADDENRTGVTAGIIGGIYETYKEDFKTAAKYYQLSVDHHNRTKDLNVRALAYWTEAYNFGQNQKDYPRAIKSYSEAIALYAQLKDTTDWKTMLCNAAYSYRDAGDSINAYKLHEQAIRLTLKNSDPANLSYAYDKAIETFAHFKNFDKKIEYLIKKYEHVKASGDQLKSAVAAKAIGTEYEEKKNDYKAADKYYQLSVEHYKKTDDKAALASAYWSTAYNQGNNQMDYPKSIDSYKNGATVYSQLNDTTNWKTMLCNIGFMYRDAGDSLNAYKVHQQAITLTLKNSDPENLTYAYTKAGETYGHFKNLNKKMEFLKKKYDLYKSIKNDQKSGVQASVIGKEYEEQRKNYQTANQYYLLSMDHFKKANDFDGLAEVYWNYGYNLDQNQKKYKEAIDNYRKSSALYAQLNDTTNWKTLLCNIGVAYRYVNDSISSYKAHQEAVDATLKNSDPANLGYAYEKFANSYGHFKNYGKKLELLKKVMALYEQAGNIAKIGESAKNIAKMYEEDFKDYKKADPYYLLNIERTNQTNDLNAQGFAYWNYGYNLGLQQQYDEAIKNYERAFLLFIANKDTSNASIMRSNVAQTLWSLQDFDKSIETHKEAIKLAIKGKNQEMIYKSWNALADLYKATGNPVNSTEAFGNAITAMEVLKDTAKLATSYADIASSYSKSKEYVKSFEYYAKAANIHKSRKDTTAWATVLYDWGGVYNTKKEYPAALEKYKLALMLYRKKKDKSNEAYCLISLASIEQSINNDYKKAELLYNEAITLAKKFNYDYVLAYCYDQMRYLYRSTGRTALAEENSLKALDMYKKLENWKQVANSLSGIGYDAYYVYGDLTKAMNFYDQAQAIADTLKDKLVLANIIEGRASVYEQRGEFTKALETIDKSYELYRAVDNEWGIAGTYIDRGNIYKLMTEYEIAMRYQFKADSMYLAMGTEYARLAPLANIGENYVAQANYPKGLEFTLKSYDIMKKAGDMDANMCIIKGNIGEIYYLMNNYSEADKWLKDGLETARKVGAKRPMIGILGSLGRLKIDEKKFAEAEINVNEGLKISKETGNTLGHLTSLVLIGKLKVEQKQYDKAKPFLEEALKISTAIGTDNALWEVEYLLGLMQKNTGNLPQSTESLKESVKVIEKVRNKVTGGEEAQKLFSSDKNILKVYDALVEVLLAQGLTEEAMTYIQKNNEDNLKAKFKGLDVKFENEKKQRAVADERNMKAKLDGIEQQILNEKLLAKEKQNTDKLKTLEGVKTIAESDYIKFVNQQINVQPELSKFFNNSVQPTQFRKIKNKIPKDMALVSYLAGENQLYIFAATSDTVVAKIVTVSRIQLTKDISAMLNIIRSNLGAFTPLDLKNEVAERKEIVNNMKQTDAMVKPFEDAYHYLIAPVSKEIAGKTRLGIIPTGALNYIPFQMLGKTLANGKFSLMMSQYSIFYANSTDMLFRDESDNEKKYNILAFGNPDKSLPSTEKEVNDIKKLYPSASIFLREEATEDKAKYANENYNVMHFATHGNLDYEDFSKSFITMAGNPSKSEDGKLTLEELWGMEVMTHLHIVVLSACQTAVTKGSNESSAVSPASGFLQNGVKSVVATLWKVDDEATSLLMADFYKNIKTMDSVDALRSAQITLSKNPKFVHPYYWAAVVLLGDWR